MAATRWGILSTANINRLVLEGARLSDEVEIAAVASRDRARAEAYAREHGIPRAHDSYEALLADDGIDAVYVSLPEPLRRRGRMHALAAGKHVLCEKPYTRRSSTRSTRHPTGRRARARAHGGVHVAAPAADALILELLPQIGELQTIRATFCLPPGEPRRTSASAPSSRAER